MRGPARALRPIRRRSGKLWPTGERLASAPANGSWLRAHVEPATPCRPDPIDAGAAAFTVHRRQLKGYRHEFDFFSCPEKKGSVEEVQTQR